MSQAAEGLNSFCLGSRSCCLLVLQEQQQNITALEARAADLESQLAEAQQAAAAAQAESKAAASAAKQGAEGTSNTAATAPEADQPLCDSARSAEELQEQVSATAQICHCSHSSGPQNLRCAEDACNSFVYVQRLVQS